MPLDQPTLKLANRLYVPEQYVTGEMRDQFTYTFSWLEDSGNDFVDQSITYEAFDTFDFEGQRCVGFARGDIGKILDVFADFNFKDDRAIVPLGYDLDMLEEIEVEGKMIPHASDPRWSEQSTCLAQWLKLGYGTLKAPPGWGKTVWIWRLICALQQKVLFFAHTTGLRDQFIERAYKHTNLADLERFHGHKKIAGAYDSYYNQIYPITASTFQAWYSDSQQEKLRGLRYNAGLVIVDEGHHVPALTYARIILELAPMYLVSITATPERKDGTHVLLFDVCGPVTVTATGEQLPCEVTFINTECVIDQKTANGYYAGPWNYLLKKITTDRERTDIIVRKVVEDVQAGHKVLVLSDRQAHGEEIASQINAWGYRAKCIFAYTGNRSEIKQEVMDDKLDVICSGKVFQEGEDLPPLSSLHIVTPNSNGPKTEQMVGRIRRPYSDKLPPVIRDYVDEGHSMIYAAKNTRAAKYVELKFKIHYPPARTKTNVGIDRWS